MLKEIDSDCKAEQTVSAPTLEQVASYQVEVGRPPEVMSWAAKYSQIAANEYERDERAWECRRLESPVLNTVSSKIKTRRAGTGSVCEAAVF